MSSGTGSISVDVNALLAASAQHVTDYLRGLPARFPQSPPILLKAMDYSLMAGGKRMRPALVIESARACGVTEHSSSQWKSVLAAAGAMELIHTFSLVHDDLPAMDDDDLRRGQPTNHKVFGEAMAILAGDAMTTVAFEVLADDAAPNVAIRLVKELASASGPDGMIGGQVLDMDSQKRPENLTDLQRLHRMKTGALLTASCRMGAIAAGASSDALHSLDKYGQHMGLAFQIVDDILDQTSTPEQLGKATGKDAAKGKLTYPMLLGIEESHRQARAQLAAALAVIERFGAAAEPLRALARFVVERNV